MQQTQTTILRKTKKQKIIKAMRKHQNVCVGVVLWCFVSSVCVCVRVGRRRRLLAKEEIDFTTIGPGEATVAFALARRQADTTVCAGEPGTARKVNERSRREKQKKTRR